MIVVVHLKMQHWHCGCSFFDKFCSLTLSFLFLCSLHKHCRIICTKCAFSFFFVCCLQVHCQIVYIECAFSFLFVCCSWVCCQIVYIKCVLCLWKLIYIFGANLYTQKINMLECSNWKDVNKLHSKNFELVSRSRFETLNWSCFCE